MITILLLTGAVLFSILIWPINKWSIKNGAQTITLGISHTFAGFILSLLLVLFDSANPLNMQAFFYGCLMGVGYAFGFNVIIAYCLKIGPAAPTVTLNNLGILGPIILHLLFFP